MALGVAMLTLAAATAGGGERPPLMPWPASIELGPGELVIGPGFRIAVVGKGGPIVERAAKRLEARLARQTGLVLPSPVAVAEKASLEIRCDAAGSVLPHLGMDESYTLTVRTGGAVLQAAEPWGVLRGMETFLQLVGTGPLSAFRAPAVVVRDRPRFPWRGLMLDCSRHFMPLDTVKRTLDGMAAVKLNAFHWHLTDDQGIRVESRRYPEFHRMGSDGSFYTQEQVKEIVAYAGDRGIRVYPEFDIPGHTTSWFVSHPELASMPGPYAIEREWGIMDAALDPSKEEVYRFLDGFLGEMAALFPDPYLHIGGDEVNGKHWDESERIVAFKKGKGFKDNHALLGYFSQRLSQIVTSHGKKMIGWDEILLPSLPKDAVVHSWRGQESLGAAAKQGYQGILSNGYYIDLMWSADRHYATDPWGKGVDQLPEAERSRILGGEATMWSEFTPPELVDSRIWPRTAAIAERLWSPREVADVDDMYARLEETSRWLEWLGLEHRSSYTQMLERLAGTRADELRQLADVVEPLEDYQRGNTGHYTQLTAYVRLMDAARPESDAARRFARHVDAFLADPTRQAGGGEIRRRLQEWQGLEPRLLSLLEGNEILREAVPLAAEASALAGAGLEAVGFLEERKAGSESWWNSRVPLLTREETPRTGLEVAYRPSVEKLMRAAAGR